MIMIAKPKGRKRKYAEYDELLGSLPKVMTKRPKYVNGIGIFRGASAVSVWLKIHLPHGADYRGKSYKRGSSIEIKVGNLSSWSWQELEEEQKLVGGRLVQVHQEDQHKMHLGQPVIVHNVMFTKRISEKHVQFTKIIMWCKEIFLQSIHSLLDRIR